MYKIKGKLDNKGNVIIEKESFEMILNCLDNQKFINEVPINGDSISVGKGKYYSIQEAVQMNIDNINKQCREILNNYV